MDPLILIFVATAAASGGFLLGFLIRALTRRKTDSDSEREPAPNPDKTKGTDAISEPVAEPEYPPVAPNVIKKKPKRNWIEVANLWRDGSDGGLIFQIEDQYYKRGDELTNRERELLLRVVMDFYGWLEPPSAISSKSEASGKPEPNIESKTDIAYASTSETLQEVSLEEQNEPKSERLTPVNFVSRILSTEVPVPTPPTPSMVAQVNNVLQEKLQAANMQKWAVRLTESPTKGMIVFIGLEQYETIDEVPYERVRSIIRDSVAEWERRADTRDSTN